MGWIAAVTLLTAAAVARPSAPPPEAPAVFKPQSGPQTQFLSTSADIAIMGGSVFGGKTWSLVYEPARHAHVPGFTFVCFRRVSPEIRNPGGLWDESLTIYPYLNGTPRESVLTWDFPSGANGRFAGLQHDKDVLGWKGAQICLLEFDQLEEFSEHMFWYLLSRNRSMCGVRPYVRATCNPDPDSFLAKMLEWWIDQETGYAIPERSGVIRWLARDRDTLVWADSMDEMVAKLGPRRARYARTFTFVLARLQDNVIGNQRDPDYEARIRLMPLVEQERLLGGDKGGNWKIRAAAGNVFNRDMFEIVDAVPAGLKPCRGWDKAATRGDGDLTSGIRLDKAADGVMYITDRVAGQWAPGERDRIIKNTVTQDGRGVPQRFAQDPAQAGVSDKIATTTMLNGYIVHHRRETGDKVLRAGPLATQVQAGNVKILRASWTEELLRYLHAFPTKGIPDDDVDALCNAYEEHISLRPPARPAAAPVVSPFTV